MGKSDFSRLAGAGPECGGRGWRGAVRRDPSASSSVRSRLGLSPADEDSGSSCGVRFRPHPPLAPRHVLPPATWARLTCAHREPPRPDVLLWSAAQARGPASHAQPGADALMRTRGLERPSGMETQESSGLRGRADREPRGRLGSGRGLPRREAAAGLAVSAQSLLERSRRNSAQWGVVPSWGWRGTPRNQPGHSQRQPGVMACHRGAGEEGEAPLPLARHQTGVGSIVNGELAKLPEQACRCPSAACPRSFCPLPGAPSALPLWRPSPTTLPRRSRRGSVPALQRGGALCFLSAPPDSGLPRTCRGTW